MLLIMDPTAVFLPFSPNPALASEIAADNGGHQFGPPDPQPPWPHGASLPGERARTDDNEHARPTRRYETKYDEKHDECPWPSTMSSGTRRHPANAQFSVRRYSATATGGTTSSAGPLNPVSDTGEPLITRTYRCYTTVWSHFLSL